MNYSIQLDVIMVISEQTTRLCYIIDKNYDDAYIAFPNGNIEIMLNSLTSFDQNRLCLLDWDGTLREGYTILDWIVFLVSKGVIKKQYLDEMLNLKTDMVLRKVNYNHTVWKSAQIYARAIKGCNRLMVENLAEEFVSHDQGNLKPFAVHLLELLNRKKYPTIVVTGAPDLPMKEYKKILNISYIYSTEIRESNTYTYTAKVQAFWGSKIKKMRLVRKLNIQKYDVFIAIGDSDADLPMIKNAKYGIYITQDMAKIVSKNKQLTEIVNTAKLVEKIEEII